METKRTRPTGMAAFTVVWVGQIFSLLGTAVSQFALTLWAYEMTGQATPLALVGVFFTVPMVVMSPFVGVLVDRLNRRLVMMFSDLSAALTTAIILVLYATGHLQVWHLYITATISGIFQGFQWPAYSAAITTMLPKTQYARANGMLDLAGNGSAVLAPVLAGALIGPLGLGGLLAVDLCAAAVAIGTLLFVQIPQPALSASGREGRGSFLKEAAYGFRYIFARPGLLGLLSVFMSWNFCASGALAVLAPMVLGRSGNNPLVFGSVQTVGAIGGVVGGLAMSVWGGPKRRVQGVLLGCLTMALLGMVVLGLGQSLPVWAAGLFVLTFFGPIVAGSSQAIWQAKVAPDVQGRVFATRRLFAFLAGPLAQLLAGPLSDRVLGPAMLEGGRLVPVFGWLVGSGTGAGISLLFVFAGLLAALVSLGGQLLPAVREVEDVLPDHDAVVVGQPVSQAAAAG